MPNDNFKQIKLIYFLFLSATSQKLKIIMLNYSELYFYIFILCLPDRENVSILNGFRAGCLN